MAKIKVLIVDDSTYIQKVFQELLSRNPSIEVVGTASDGAEALDKIEQLKPDVVTVDLMMPKMNGVECLQQQMKRRPLPMIVVTSLTEDADLLASAMSAGAFDFVRKPSSQSSEEILEIGDNLIKKIQEAANMPMG